MAQLTQIDTAVAGCAGARAAARRGVVRIDRNRGSLSWENAQVPQAIRARLQHFHLHHYLRLSLVDIMNHLLGQQQFVRRVAHDNRVLRIKLLDSLQVKQLAQPGHDLGQILRLNRV